MVWNKHLKREIPAGWGVNELGDLLIKIDSGKRPAGGIDNSLKTGIPSLGAECIDRLGLFDFSSVPYIKEEYRSILTSGKIEDNDILIYKDGAYVGKVTLFRDHFPFEEAFVNEHVFLIRAKHIHMEEYLLFTLMSKTYFKIMQSLGKAKAAQPGLNQSDLKKILVLVPNNRIVTKYHDIVNTQFGVLFNNAKQTEQLISLRNKTLPLMMNGQIDVRPLNFDLSDISICVICMITNYLFAHVIWFHQAICISHFFEFGMNNLNCFCLTLIMMHLCLIFYGL